MICIDYCNPIDIASIFIKLRDRADEMKISDQNYLANNFDLINSPDCVYDKSL